MRNFNLKYRERVDELLSMDVMPERDARGGLRGHADPQEVPRFLRIVLYGLILIAAVTSVPQLGMYSPVPVGTLVDVWIIVFILTCVLRGRTQSVLLLLLLLGYLLSRFVPAIMTESPMPDFLQAYRWVLYLIAFALAIGRRWGPTRPLMHVAWLVIALALLKTVATIAVLGPSKRSGLLIENNFELALFCGLVAVLYSSMTYRARMWTMLLLGALVVTSGSRSGAVAFAILVVYAVSQARGVSLFGRYIIALAIPVLVYGVVQVFENRADVGGVDRLNFLGVFLSETTTWSPVTWLIGTTPLTPLSAGGCNSLAYYQALFSSSADGSCYSVVLHAFAMRVVYDAGIVGLVGAFAVTIYAMRRANVRPWLTAALALIAMANSFSVSGLNSPYVALPILIAIAMAGTAHEKAAVVETRPEPYKL